LKGLLVLGVGITAGVGLAGRCCSVGCSWLKFSGFEVGNLFVVASSFFLLFGR